MNDRLNATLDYIALGSADPAALAGWYRDAMGLKLQHTSQGILGREPGRNLIFVQGEPKTILSIGYAVPNADELSRLSHRLTRASWPHDFVGDEALFEPGAIAIHDPDGNRIVFGVRRDVLDAGVAGLPARLQHIVMASTNAERLSRFFQDVLGFQLSDNVVDDEGEVRTAFLRCSEEHHSFAVFQASTNRLDHHCYEAGDWGLIRDWGDHFAARKIKIEWGPGRHGPGNNLFLFVHDHEGNWVEISAELETVDRERPAGIWPHAQSTLNTWGTAPMRT